MSSPAKIHVPFELVPSEDGSFAICWKHIQVLRFSARGMLAQVGEGARQHFALIDILRWGAPFALVERGLVLLHAACVAHQGRAVALMAPGGTGKSSLGGVLHNAGWTTIADDALLCDADGHVGPRAEAVLRAWCREQAPRVEGSGCVDYESLAESLLALRASVAMAQQQLDAIAFLRLPRNHNGLFTSERVAAVSGFHELAQHSFGAAPGSVAWAHEARVYQGLASAVPLWSVHAPEGLEAMQGALPQWLATLAVGKPLDAVGAASVRAAGI
jgi:hypothetical protein